MEVTSSKIKEIFGFSRQQLYYWREEGVISPSRKTSTDTSHFRYNYNDLRVLKTIHDLQKLGISTQIIKRSFFGIRRIFPKIENPFVGMPILLFGKRIIFVYKGKGYDALTGQQFILNFKKMEGWKSKIIPLHKPNELNKKDHILVLTYGNERLRISYSD